MDRLPDDELPFQPARPDSTCAHHPEREAIVRCPMCELDVCFSCFFPDYARCQRCLEAHPDEVADRIPLESSSVGTVRGFGSTLLGALSPRATAPSFAIGDDLSRPLGFFLATFVPFALLRGVIPYTQYVHFGALGAVSVVPHVSSRMLAIDVLRASLISLAEVSFELAAFAVCFISLAAAFGREGIRRVAVRALAYRAFLLPLGGVLGVLPMLLAWIGPAKLASLETMFTIGAIPLVPFFLALHRTVRTVGRVDAGPGIAVAVVPWALVGALALITERAMAPLFPEVPPPADSTISAGR